MIISQQSHLKFSIQTVLTKICFIRAYKPILAQLSEPQFLIEGDSAEIVGKALNYSNDNYQLNTSFNANNKTITNDFLLNAKASEIRKFSVIADSQDSLKANFSLTYNNRV
jgi:alpha-2-macroglobulin